MTTKQLYDYLESPNKPELRYFPYGVAKTLSDLAAILLYDLQWRIGSRKPLIKHGRNWTYDAMRVFTETHPYASESGIRMAFLALENAGFIVIKKTGKYNSASYDRKWWYSLTTAGMRSSRLRRIRYCPTVAESLDIPKAVLLQKFHHDLHSKAETTSVILDPKTLILPYSSKTISRHLNQLVEMKILRKTQKHGYAIAEDTQPQAHSPGTPPIPHSIDIAPSTPPPDPGPLTIRPDRLLPALSKGVAALLVAPSGTGKTSFSVFSAVQLALAGTKVIYITVEEPIGNIVERMNAGEFGVTYTDLHRGISAASEKIEAEWESHSDRRALVTKNLRMIDLSGRYPEAHELLAAIAEIRQQGFEADVVILDQLEFIGIDQQTDDEEMEGRAMPRAIALAETLRGSPFSTWILHQIDGNVRETFSTEDVVGGADVVDCFDAVIGIGRIDHGDDKAQLRIFSLTPTLPFSQTIDANFAIMRFVPR
jgi:hypothetical protein